MVLSIEASTIARAAEALTTVLADGAVKCTVVLLLVGGTVAALRGAAAATRHLMWVLAVGALLLLPGLSLVAPRWQVPFPIELGRSSREWGSHVAPPLAGPQPDEVATHAASAHVPGPPGSAEVSGAVARGPASDGMVPNDRGSVSPIGVMGPVPRAGGFFDWHLWLALTWLGGAVLVLTAVATSVVGTRSLDRAATELAHGRLVRLTQLFAGQLGIRAPVRVLRGRRGAMPMTWGIFEPTILLPADAEVWSDDRLRAVLLHELAHVRRRDYLTQMAARLMGACYWYHPLVWLAVRRLRRERELACDDVVLTTGAKPSSYAAHLLEIARGLKASPLSSVVGVAMARPSQLSGRLLAVLDAGRSRRSRVPRVAVPALFATAAVMVPMAGATLGPTAAPATGAAGELAAASVTTAMEVTPSNTGSISRAGPALVRAASAGKEQAGECRWDVKGGKGSASVSIQDDELHIRIQRDDCRLELDAAGAVIFNEDESDVASIADGGYFEIEEREGREVRRLEMRPTASGELERRWLVNGRERWTVTGEIRGHDAEASAWLARLLPVIFRRTGFQAEERAQRILARAGVRGVLAEVAEITSDYAAREYLTVLLRQRDLAPAQVRDIVRLAGEQISSDYELAELLIAVAREQPTDDLVQTAYVEATATVESDYEHRRALAAVLERHNLSLDLAAAVLRQAINIESDYELAELLIDILGARPLEEALTPAFFAAANTIDSDYERRRVLQFALERGTADQAVLDRTLESAIEIDSDYELAELLIEVARRYPIGRALPASYVTAAQTLNSDHEAGRVWSTLIEREVLDPNAVMVLLDAVAGSIESDWELANILASVVRRHSLEDRAVPAFFRALGTIDSDAEHGRVLKALIDHGSLNATIVSAVLESALQIQSDFELANVLVGVAEAFPIDGALRPAYIRAAETIGSRYERERAFGGVGGPTP